MYKQNKTQIRIIKQTDPRFMLSDGLVVAPRAGFEINERCPQEYRQIIAACIDCGWLKPVAYMSERELIFTGLSSH